MSSDGLTFQVKFRGAVRTPKTPNTTTVIEAPAPPESTRHPTGKVSGTGPRTRTDEGGNVAGPVSEPAPHTAASTTPGRPNRGEPLARRLARMLALAYLVELEIESGRCRDYVAAAERLGITRARMTQIANLATLSPEIQELVLTNDLDATERDLREIATEIGWENQIDRLRAIWRTKGRSGEAWVRHR